MGAGGWKVVLVTGSLGEGAGGLASAVRAWAETLAAAGAGVTVFCLDLSASSGVNRPPRHPNVQTIEVPCLVERRSRLVLAPRLQESLLRHCREWQPDVIHANGVWLPGTRIAARVARRLGLPFVVSPHGHLQPWAMRHRRFKKRMAWVGYGRRSLRRASLVQAASAAERDSVRGLGIRIPIALVPNVVDLPSCWPPARRGPEGVRTVLFLARIHPSKGLLDLVKAWDRLRPADWRVVVAGPDESGHLAEVRRTVADRGLTASFEFVGQVAHAERWAWYRAADLFVLPTYSENFGVTVAEALGAGVPVITTRAAPWRALVERDCGWWVDTGPRALQEALGAAVSLDDNRRAAMGERGRDLVLSHYSADAVARTLIEAYRWARDKRQMPPFIDRPWQGAD